MENNRAYKDFDDIDAMLNIFKQDNRPQKKERVVNNESVFAPDEIDPADYVTKVQRLNEIYANVNARKGPVELAQEKRHLKKERERLKKEERRLIFRKLAIAASLTAAITGGAALTAKYAPRINDNRNVSKISDELTNKAKDALLAYELASLDDGEFKIGNNSVSDYSVLDADTPMEVYVYRKAINDNEEFSKFIRSVSYDDGLYNYESYEQFLRINGYYDTTTNSVSSEVFDNYMEATILEAYKNSTVSSYEDEFSYSFNLDEEESHKTR